MSFEKIEALLERRIGMTSTSVGSSTIIRAANIRMKICDITDDAAYYGLLTQSTAEFTNFVETVIVPETWFFRDYHPFAGLQEYVKCHWINSEKNTPLRILSIPCSTGEEPYSIAMALLDLDLTHRDFAIDAVDISSKNLQIAQHGVYRANSFRGEYLAFKDRYFHDNNGEFAIDPSVKRCVHFLQGNILENTFVEHLPVYDIVFCRNLLIYFDQVRQNQCFKTLDQKLDSMGILFLGHAESFTALQSSYTPAKYTRSFAFLKPTATLPKPSIAVLHEPTTETPQTRVTTVQKLPKNQVFSGTITQSPQSEIAALPETPQHTTTDRLETAQLFADQGKLLEAESLCKDHLARDSTSAQAHYLLGLIREASSEKSLAFDNFRKTIYLDPDHYAALIHLASLAEYQGDSKSAQIYRQRAQRAKQRGSS